ncbi:hypothetical protein HHK36_000249 [Tetracentron sinense]|uniref:KIB1-4 beta-propeller domain-containing protein n=1 Tax=Tetracentron sinense TaxID=13715 RepID=A0A835DPU3_TETSI|nr:hypothetical protein HHK36_000249 [Tetracentron sinense]
MLSEQKNSDTRAFFSLSEGMIHERTLPEARGKRCWGSQGWLITFSIDFNISLLNPLTRLQIQLPPHRTFKNHYDTSEEDEEFGYTPIELQEMYILKAIVSSSPSSTSDYVVMVIHGPNIQLAFARPGDEAWTTIEETRPARYFDVIYYKEKFYAVNSLGVVVVCDVQGPNPTDLQIIAKAPKKLLAGCPRKIYLVESSGTLLVVSRYVHSDEVNEVSVYQTTEFRVFKPDLSKSNGKWVELKNLGDRALFLGHSSSMSIVASDFPKCKANCIYFTDDLEEPYCCNPEGGGKDMGIFDLEDGSFMSHYTVKKYDGKPALNPVRVGATSDQRKAAIGGIAGKQKQCQAKVVPKMRLQTWDSVCKHEGTEDDNIVPAEETEQCCMMGWRCSAAGKRHFGYLRN